MSENDSEQQIQIGKKLREARQAKGYTLDDLQQITKIQKRYLIAIEDEKFDELPGDFYVRAFIKQYANTVGLDGKELLREYDDDLPEAKTAEYSDHISQAVETRASQRKTVSNSVSKARQYYDEFFRLNPQAPSINRARYAYTFLKQRNYADAFINITMAKTEDPEDPSYWLISARAYKGLNRIDDALADLDIALQLAPEREDLKPLRAMWLYQAGNYEQSLADTQALLTRNPDNELALFMLYMNLQKTGQTKQAREQLKKIQELDQDSFARRVADRLLEKK